MILIGVTESKNADGPWYVVDGVDDPDKAQKDQGLMVQKGRALSDKKHISSIIVGTFFGSILWKKPCDVMVQSSVP